MSANTIIIIHWKLAQLHCTVGQVGCFGRDSAPCARFYSSLPAGTWALVLSVPPGVHVVTVGTCGCEYCQVTLGYHLHLHNARHAFDFSLLQLSLFTFLAWFVFYPINTRFDNQTIETTSF